MARKKVTKKNNPKWVAKKYGFKSGLEENISTQIANKGYSADVDRFLKVNPSPLNRTFLYVGRLIKEKGLDDLLDGYELYRKALKDPWGLRIVGNGKLKQRILRRSIPGVCVADFIQPSLLPYEYAGSSCFILASKFEPWGLVLH